MNEVGFANADGSVSKRERHVGNFFFSVFFFSFLAPFLCSIYLFPFFVLFLCSICSVSLFYFFVLFLWCFFLFSFFVLFLSSFSQIYFFVSSVLFLCYSDSSLNTDSLTRHLIRVIVRLSVRFFRPRFLYQSPVQFPDFLFVYVSHFLAADSRLDKRICPFIHYSVFFSVPDIDTNKQ